MKKIILASLIIISGVLSAQVIKVIETKKIEIENIDEAFYPRFSHDDSKIIFSTENYNGLYSYNIKTETTSVISEENGSGYNPLIVDEKLILYRTYKINQGRKFHTINMFNTKTKAIEIIESNKRGISIPKQIIGNELLLIENSTITKRVLRRNTLLKTSQKTISVYVDNDNLIIVKNDDSRILNPLGEGAYVWESISKDGDLIIFTFGNQGSFICDLEGNIIANIKEAHYPRLSSDGKFVSYMKDRDDGYNYISSDIYIYSIEMDKSFQITNSEDKIEMYAEWSNDNSSLVYHNLDGEIFITKIEIEN